MASLDALPCDHHGTRLVGQLAIPDGPGPHSAVMVMHNAFGLGKHMREVTLRLAGLGYVALATDMYGAGVFHDDGRAAHGDAKKLWDDPALLRERVTTWYELLKARPEVDAARVAAIGYCLGGQCVLELARSGADVKAVVSYHGVLSTALPAQPGVVTAQVAVYNGALDPFIPRDTVEAFHDEMTAAGASFQIITFGGVYHSFTDPHAGEAKLNGLVYDALADRLSWQGTLALFDATIGVAA